MKNKTVYIISLIIILQLAGCKKESNKDVISTWEIGTSTIDSVSYYTALISTSILKKGDYSIIQHGHCWSASSQPTIEDSHTSLGEVNSNLSIESELQNLDPMTSYLVRPYLKYANGIIYGEVVQFTTAVTGLPEVKTFTYNLYASWGVFSCVVHSDSGLAVSKKGIIWGDDPNLNLQANIGFTEHEGDSFVRDTLKNLSIGNTYYICAYAINGNGVSYGEKVQFSPVVVEIDFVWVPGGLFQMGNEEESPKHKVTLDNYSISRYEITNEQYCLFLNSIHCNSDGFYNDPEFGYIEYFEMEDDDCQIEYIDGLFVTQDNRQNYPVIEVNWFGSFAYANWAECKLPTEAEWEFAAGGGRYNNLYPYSGSGFLEEVAWANFNSGGHTHEVGTKLPNELGIYDMTGNVDEFCNDWYGWSYYSESPEFNPTGPSTGTLRITRGSSWNIHPFYCDIERRGAIHPHQNSSSLGFRVAR